MSGIGVFFLVVILLIGATFAGYTVWVRLRAKRLGLPPPSLNPFARESSRSSVAASALPAPAPGGIVGWVNDKMAALKNRRNRRGDPARERYAAGAYEEAGVGGGAGAPAPGPGSGGFGGESTARGGARGLDPDEAWDTRVGNEAYYEEQELGLHEPTAYSGAGYTMAGEYGGNAYAAQSRVDLGDSGYGGGAVERGRSRSRELDDRYGGEELGRTTTAGSDPFGDTAERSDMGLRGVSPRPIDTSVGGRNQPQQASGDSAASERRSMFREDV
ncbi:hypothetical protein IWX90DRAFT_484643 [Phyllosticta citrichinensis]|uniref:Uncharacterized protein n=1 Tax=Phyllosticta citrichinensis TaxID=1130410 RepID=A0ABR1XZG5_9PEZI